MRVVIELDVPNDVRNIERIVELVSRQIRELDFPARACSLNVPVALSEALSNAMLRGNRDDHSKHVHLRALVDPAVSGPVNAVAPDPVRNADGTKILGGVLRRPTGVPASGVPDPATNGYRPHSWAVVAWYSGVAATCTARPPSGIFHPHAGASGSPAGARPVRGCGGCAT